MFVGYISRQISQHHHCSHLFSVRFPLFFYNFCTVTMAISQLCHVESNFLSRANVCQKKCNIFKNSHICTCIFFVQSLFLDLCLYTFLSFCDLRFVLLFKSPFLRILELHYCVLSTFPNKSWLLRPVVVVFSLLLSIYL